MNRKMRITSEEPASPRLAPHALGRAWRRQAATALLVGWGCLPLLQGLALAELPLLYGGRQLSHVASLKVTSQVSDLPLTVPSRLAVLTEPAAQETPLKSARLASLPRYSSTPLLLPSLSPLPKADATAPSHMTALGRLPLAFIENKGQVDERARFYVRSGGQTVWLTSEGLRFDLLRVKGGAESRPETPSPAPRHPTPASPPQPPDRERLVFAQDFLGAAATRPTIEASHPLPGIYNFFIGKDPAKWRTGVTGYATLTYRDVWDGIDLKLYGNGRALEQEFIVRPGGDLSRIKVAYRGITGLTVAQDGSLLIKTAFGELKESPPRIYQEIDGKRIEVAGRFKLLGATAYTFEVGPHHPQYALVIDPTLVYSTFLGGSNNDEGRGIAADAAGNAYVTGVTYSSNFPATLGILDASLGGSRDAFVTKLNPTGSGLFYSTFLGGSNSDDGNGIAVDASGNAYVTGLTYSSDFPTTPGAFDTSFNGVSDAFVTKLNPTGSALVFSTFLGGSDGEHLVQSHFLGEFGDNAVIGAIALDASSNVYVAGITFSSDFPTTPGAFDTSYNGRGDAFVTKIDSTGSSLIYSTFLGGSDLEEGVRGMAVDALGNAYVTGPTFSSDFPTTPGAFDTSFNGGLNDPFVTKLNSMGQMVYSTFLGGTCWDGGEGIAVDASGNAYVTGGTCSSNFPVTPGAFDTRLDGYDAAFVTKLDSTGSSLIYSTFLGGSGQEFGSAIAVDTSGNAYVTGGTTSSNFPTTPGAFDTSHNGGTWDAFVTQLNPAGSALVYSTFLGGSGAENRTFLSPYQPHITGGIALDTSGNAYVTGSTYSTDFLTTPGAFQGTYAGGGDAFVTRFAFGTLTLSVSAILPGTGGDTGLVSVTILGGGYLSGATVKLVRAGQPDIVGDPVTIGAGGVSITTTFDLIGKARGAWDVVVTNPNGASATLPGGFTIEEGRAPQLWVDIVGRDVIARGRNVTYQIQSRNNGNIDATDVLIWVAVPEGVTFTTADVPYLTALGPQPQDPPVIQDGYVYLWFYTDKLRPSESKSFRLGLSGAAPGQIEVRGGILEGTSLLQSLSQQPVPTALGSRVGLNASADGLQQRGSPSALVQNTTPQNGDLVFKLSDSNEPARTGHVGIYVDGYIIDLVPTNVLFQLGRYRRLTLAEFASESGTLGFGRPPNASDAQATQAAINAKSKYDFWVAAGSPPVLFDVPPILPGRADCVSFVSDAYRSAGYNPLWPNWAAVGSVYELTMGNSWPEKSIWKYLNRLTAPLVGWYSIAQKTRAFFFKIAVVGSMDPNDKVATAGYGPTHYVAGSSPLQYLISFENQETATAPAQEVVVTDQLDLTKMDLSTFSLGPIAFGDKEVTPPAGLSEFTTDVDLRPAKDLLVRINARLDPATGLLTWRLTSIDPATGQLPDDPLAGFLPPNRTAPEGEGSLLFTIRPKPGLPTGTEVRNRATIVFDVNPPIATPEWLNTLDNTKPQSQVLPLADTQSSATFPIQWTGTDEGSGLKDYTVFVSEDGGPFAVWLPNTPDTGGSFTGQHGKTYAFYSIARDQTGNLEQAPPIADTVTQVTIAVTSSVVLNRTSVRTGDLLRYNASIGPASLPEPVDIYLGALLPDGVTFFSLVETGPGTVSSVLGPRPVPFRANVQTGVTFPFEYTFTGSEPPGTYFTYAGVTRAGRDPSQQANQLAVSIASFTYVTQ